MGTPVLMYHSLDESGSAIWLNPTIFAEQMRLLHQGGYNVIPLSQVVKCRRDGQSPPDKSVVFTFDDGLMSFYLGH
jgi:peptidoglycan/xylan/chitin deacetylase (PgdA/CDA1 family)